MFVLLLLSTIFLYVGPLKETKGKSKVTCFSFFTLVGE